MAFNANSTEIEKMDTGLKNLELTLDEEERLLQNSSGDESSNKKVVSSVGGLTPSDLAKIASLRTLKNKRNHDRKRLRMQETPAALVNSNSAKPNDESKKLRAETNVSGRAPTLLQVSEKDTKGLKSGSVEIPCSVAPPAASKRSSDAERLNSQLRKRMRIAATQPTRMRPWKQRLLEERIP